MTDVKVLIVDDEEDFSDILAERMEARGFQVSTVNSGAAAIEQVKQRSYDAIILDLAMPEMDGIETLKRLLVVNPDLQVILLTGHATIDKGVEAVKLGAADFLEKPADLDSLVRKVKDARLKMLDLFEKRLGESIDDIVRKKGW